MLSGVLQCFGPVAGQLLGDDQAAAVGQGLENAPAVGVLGAQQRSTVERQDVERPELDRVDRARFCISPKLGTPDSSSATTSPSSMT